LFNFKLVMFQLIIEKSFKTGEIVKQGFLEGADA
jgi:hypothetical protein